jgi:hypothetical protein
MKMNVEYSPETIEKEDLQKFSQIAWEVLRYTQYGRGFSKHVICIALCQGGANHYAVTHGDASRYLDPEKAGLKDIDIWFFFNKPGFHPLWRRTCDLGSSKFGKNPEDSGYIGRRMDFFGRSIAFQLGDDLRSALLRWLQNGKPKSSPWYIAQKAVVALYPEKIMGDVLWVSPKIK